MRLQFVVKLQDLELGAARPQQAEGEQGAKLHDVRLAYCNEVVCVAHTVNGSQRLASVA
jgi:hypothetical protein